MYPTVLMIRLHGAQPDNDAVTNPCSICASATETMGKFAVWADTLALPQPFPLEDVGS